MRSMIFLFDNHALGRRPKVHRKSLLLSTIYKRSNRRLYSYMIASSVLHHLCCQSDVPFYTAGKRVDFLNCQYFILVGSNSWASRSQYYGTQINHGQKGNVLFYINGLPRLRWSRRLFRPTWPFRCTYRSRLRINEETRPVSRPNHARMVQWYIKVDQPFPESYWRQKKGPVKQLNWC